MKKASTRGDEAIVGSWLSDAGGGPMLWVDGSGKYRLTIGSSPSLYLDSGHPAAAGIWEHVAGTWDGTTARIYVNGVEAASEPAAPSQIGGRDSASARW